MAPTRRLVFFFYSFDFIIILIFIFFFKSVFFSIKKKINCWCGFRRNIGKRWGTLISEKNQTKKERIKRIRRIKRRRRRREPLPASRPFTRKRHTAKEASAGSSPFKISISSAWGSSHFPLHLHHHHLPLYLFSFLLLLLFLLFL